MADSDKKDTVWDKAQKVEAWTLQNTEGIPTAI